MTFASPSLLEQIQTIHAGWEETLARQISLEIAIKDRQRRLTHLIAVADDLAAGLGGDEQELAEHIATELRFLA